MKTAYANEILAILKFFKQHESFAIIGHEEPDGDCLSSQLAIMSFLKREGKDAVCYSPGPFLRPEIKDIEGEFSKGSAKAADAAIVVDCSTLDRIGRYSDDIAALPTAVIDHHSAGAPFGEVRYIDPSAPSVTFQILNIFEAAGINPNPREAELLFFGLCTDTGFFRHLGADSQAAFAASGRLVAAGASPKATFARMFGNRTHDSRKLVGRLLERAELRFDGRLLVTWESAEELEEFGKHQRDSDALYQQLQMVQGCDIVVLVRQESEETCSVGLRSSGDVDVGEIARGFGGGGHRGAAGCSRTGLALDVARDIVDLFKSIL
jgi:bifunctional oligoribonuclease and PAP phosphatase NrnA